MALRLAFFQRDVSVANRLVPFVTTVLFALLSVVPVHVPGLAVATPAFVLMAVYHWTIYRPDLLPAVGVFAAGILLDLLNGTPYLGISSLALLLVRGVILAQRRLVAGQSFPILWAGFFTVTATFIAFEWLVTSILNGLALGSRPFVFQALLTIVTFPVGSYLLAQAQRAFLRRV